MKRIRYSLLWGCAFWAGGFVFGAVLRIAVNYTILASHPSVVGTIVNFRSSTVKGAEPGLTFHPLLFYKAWQLGSETANVVGVIGFSFGIFGLLPRTHCPKNDLSDGEQVR